MRLFSYVVRRDYGFAPNPFFGACTLATCKPNIRRTAKVGDWVIGSGSAQQRRTGRLVYAMKVDETMSFNQYWESERYRRKRPLLRGSRKQAYGDNIYHFDGQWRQLDSHHSHPNGQGNPHNIANDTKADRVLVGREFMYFGGSGPTIPDRFRNWEGVDICARRNHRRHFPEGMPEAFVEWLKTLDASGYCGSPLDW